MHAHRILCAALLATVACAAGNKAASGCAPAPTVFVTRNQPVYRDCAVDRKARRLKGVQFSMADLPIPANPSSSCWQVELEFVVDETGQPVLSTARVVRQNNQAFTDAVMRGLNTVLYEPASKDGKPVAQLVRHPEKVLLQRVSPASGKPPLC